MKGIIMSGDHPRKILDGSKTQTRRVIKPQPIECRGGKLFNWEKSTEGSLYREDFIKYSPYGQVGERLIIKEAWAAEKRYDHLKPSEIPLIATIFYFASIDDPATMGRKRSARFMCNWMSRIRPEITEVRVERVQEITEADCIAETGMNTPYSCYGNRFQFWDGKQYISNEKAQMVFKELWDSLNAKRGYGWDVNPWVWVISFKVAE